MAHFLPALRRPALRAALLASAVALAAGLAGSEPVEGPPELLPSGASLKGVCALILSDDPGLPASIATRSGLTVHALCTDEGLVERARQAAAREGFLGTRVVAEHWRGARLPCADGLLNLVLADALSPAVLADLRVDEVLRVLEPGGRAVLRLPRGGERPLSVDRLRGWAAVRGADAEITTFGNAVWCVLDKPWPEGVDEWTHWQHGPDNNPVSTDTVIRAPYLTQFLALPYYSPMPSFSVICGGRQFRVAGHMAIHEREEALLNTLTATDTHNGTVLWTRPVPEGFLVHRSMLIATADRLYVLEPERCAILDPATGEQRDEIRFEGADMGGGRPKWMALQEGTLYFLLGGDELPAEVTKRRRQVGAWGWDELSQGYYTPEYPWGYGTVLVALDPETKATRWRHEEGGPIDSRALCLSGSGLFIHGETRYLACLDLATGAEVWRTEDPVVLAAIAERHDAGLGFKTTPYALCTDDYLFFSGRGRRNVVGVSARDGRMLWSIPGAYNATNLLFFAGSLYAHIPVAHAIDPQTGALLKELGLGKRSCARFTGCPDSLFHRGTGTGGEGTVRWDTAAQQPTVIHAFRPPCNDGIIPAEGLLHITQWDCDCNLQLMGGIALGPAGDFVFNQSATEGERLERAERAPEPTLAVAPADWPTYRADNHRSSCTEATVPARTEVRWTRRLLDPGVSAPTTAGGLVFVTGQNGAVRALDLATGVDAWSFTTNGPVRLPPSIDRGRAYAGSGDGWLYCLDASTGGLLWRFRAAPVDRRIMVFGSLASTWPVNSGALVEDGIAYAAAGIICYDGTHVYGLDGATGAIHWQNNDSGHLRREISGGASVQGDLCLAGDRLLLAGGNLTGATGYRLSDGTCLTRLDQYEWPFGNRGSEVCWMPDQRFALMGGRRLFTDDDDTITNWQSFAVEGDGVAPNRALPGRVAPAYGHGAMAFAGRGPLVCVELDALVRWARDPDKKARLPVRWAVPAIDSAVSVAIAQNAVVAVGQTQGSAGSEWAVRAYDLASGDELWSHPLAAPGLPGGLCIGPQGEAIVVLCDGQVVCAG